MKFKELLIAKKNFKIWVDCWDDKYCLYETCSSLHEYTKGDIIKIVDCEEVNIRLGNNTFYKMVILINGNIREFSLEKRRYLMYFEAFEEC